ncbi:MAG: signal transduction histidine kinase [Glaciecola sp.]|jgi:signal transduction histidine kinase
MNDARYRIILYVIIAVIVGTIGIQVYWNYKNYGINKQQLISEVQASLDSAVETYYANLAERHTYEFAIEATSHDEIFDTNSKFDNIINKLSTQRHRFNELDSVSINIEDSDGVKIFKGQKADSLIGTFHRGENPYNNGQDGKIDFKALKLYKPDSLAIDNFKILTSKVIFSIAQDTLNLASIDSLVKKEIRRKNLDIDFGLSLNIENEKPNVLNKNTIDISTLSTSSNSTFLPQNSSLKIHFTNSTKEILKRILTGILLSAFLVLIVISCLFYLLKIIKHQKQIAEVKNDFISNITHEFKTPIATIGVALESIKNFNVINDTEKTKSYIDISNSQLVKLNVMVEKLLETASLDSENLQLNKDRSNVTDLIQILVSKHSLELTAKSLSFSGSETDIYANIDAFHFENAINNVIDNAIKYGGENINITLKQSPIGFTITISDDGTELNNTNKDKIFEKFYRIPKGNTHDVKGFGIGLYYAKKIIEKHNGAIHLNVDNQWTTFKISIQNE